MQQDHQRDGTPSEHGYEAGTVGGWHERGGVVWLQAEAHWGIDVRGERKEIHFWEINHDHLDVISTIYENPDLLETES
jgi:hypothetical protein